MRTLANIIWFLLGGWWTALGYLLLGVLLCITIVGIPIGKALFQYAKLMAVPFGKEIIKETELKGAENVSMIRKVGGTIVNIIWLPHRHLYVYCKHRADYCKFCFDYFHSCWYCACEKL